MKQSGGNRSTQPAAEHIGSLKSRITPNRIPACAEITKIEDMRHIGKKQQCVGRQTRQNRQTK